MEKGAGLAACAQMMMQTCTRMFVMTSCLYCKGVTLYHCVMAFKYVQPMHQARLGRPVHAATLVGCLLGHSMWSSNPSGHQE